MIDTLPKPGLIRFAAEKGLPTAARVDRANKTITAAKAMQIGKLSEGDCRAIRIDRVSLEQLQELIAKRPQGVKMRFAHPNASRDGLGRHVGRASNPRIVSNEVGQTYLAVDCKLNTKGGSRTRDQVEHLLDLAENSPEDFGLSIAGLSDAEVMERMEPDREGLKPLRLNSLDAIDFVDDPAATDGLFDLQSIDIQDLPAQATAALNTYFANASPEVIRTRFGEFLERYLSTRGATDMSTAPAKPAEKKPENQNPDGKKPEQLGVEEDVAALKAEIEALKAKIAEMAPEDPPADPEADMEGEPTKKPEEMGKKKALAELARHKQVTALCKLAGVPDNERDLLLSAGLSREEAQAWIKEAGYLQRKNPPLDEPGSDMSGKKPTDEEKYGKEYDEHKDIYSRQRITREQYIESRKRDAA